MDSTIFTGRIGAIRSACRRVRFRGSPEETGYTSGYRRLSSILRSLLSLNPPGFVAGLLSEFRTAMPSSYSPEFSAAGRNDSELEEEVITHYDYFGSITATRASVPIVCGPTRASPYWITPAKRGCPAPLLDLPSKGNAVPLGEPPARKAYPSLTISTDNILSQTTRNIKL